MPPPQPRKKRGPGSAADPDEGLGLVVWVDGLEYRLAIDGLTHRHELALWHETKLTVRDLLTTTHWPPFMVAAVVYLARLQRGDAVSYDEVAAAITRESEFGKPASAADDEDLAPEALGAG